MRTPATLLLALSLPSFVSACSSDRYAVGATTGCTSKAVTVAQQPVTCNGATIVAKEANDYAFSSTITLAPVTVKQMSNLTFDWSGVTQGLPRPHARSPADLNTALAMLWGLTLADLEHNLNADDAVHGGPGRFAAAPAWRSPATTTGEALRLHDQRHGDAARR